MTSLYKVKINKIRELKKYVNKFISIYGENKTLKEIKEDLSMKEDIIR